MNKSIAWSKIWLIGLAVIAVLFNSCGGSGNERVKFQKEPLDVLIKKHSSIQNFSIILNDMDYDESLNAYKHEYRVLYEPVGQDTMLEEIEPWAVVSDVFFDKHKDNMGMEIASKKDGKVSKVASPPGYSNYVGNERYGSWQKRSDGSSFWEFYGKYAFMSSMFRMAMFPVRYSYWNDYRSNYYGYGRPYYGPVNNGYSTYGSNGRYTQENGKNSKWNSRSSSFKNRVRSKVTKSASTTKANNSRKRTRSSSRYRSSSSSRSRGGGFGK